MGTSYGQQLRMSFLVCAAMSTAIKTCRLCNENVSAKRMTRLFSDKSSEQGWPRRIFDLLDIPVRPDDNLSSLVCSKCITRVKSLEIASVDLKAFKRSVRSSLKRSKETTGEVGVSPNILRERPRSKVARTLFTSNKAQHNKLLVEVGHREHKFFPNIKLNPLHKWDVKKTENWIRAKIRDYLKYNGRFRSEESASEIECTEAATLQ